MPTTHLKYLLVDGYIHHWLVAGPQTQAREPDEAAPTSDSGVTEPPVDLGPLGEATKLTWRYYRSLADHYVDFTAVHPTRGYMPAWAYAELALEAGQAATLVLTTQEPADLWVNGRHLGRYDAGPQARPSSQSIPAVLAAGRNAILVRFAAVADGPAPCVMALQVQGVEAAEVQLPAAFAPELLEERQALERVIEHATLDRYVYGYLDGDRYHQNEPIRVRFPADLDASAEITCRLQSLRGDIYQEQTKRCKAGTELALAQTFPLQNGPHHLALLPPAREYYTKNLRFERKELFHVVRTAYSAPAAARLSAQQRVTAALEDAAQRRNGSIFVELAKMRLDRWEKLDMKLLNRAVAAVSEQHLGAAAALLGLLNARLRFRKKKHYLTSIRADLDAALTGFQYDSAPGDSEGDQILRCACEILAGQALSGATFSRTGQTGQWHRARGEARASAWVRERGRYGFREWDSPASLEATVAALASLVDLAAAQTVAELAAVLLDKIFFNLAVNSFQGAYGASRGHTDTASVLSARLAATSGLSWLLWGLGNLNESVMGTVSLACCHGYALPEVIRQIAHDPVEALWSQARHTLPPAAEDPGTFTWEVNTVTYRTQDFMLSCAQDYAPGQLGRREHIWQATLGPDAVVFVNHPICLSTDEGHQPNIWAGNGVLPRAAQWGDVLIALYQLPAGDWLGFTHAYFPAAAFDEVAFRASWAFARKGNGYLALWAAGGLQPVTTGPTAHRELRSPGLENAWLCHLGQALLDGSFEEFQGKILAMHVACEGLALSVHTLRGDRLAWAWQGPLQVNGEPQTLASPRHIENPYCTADLPAAQLEIVRQGEGVRLRFD